MTARTTRTIDALAKLDGVQRRQRADAALAADLPWAVWRDALTALYLDAPERALPAARALAEAAAERGDHTLAGRFRIVLGLAQQRAGSVAAAAETFLAAGTLLAPQEPAWGTIANVYAVDALAHAGEIDAALALAEETAKTFSRGAPPSFRAVLRGNRANALRLAGRLEEAISCYESAARSFARLGLVSNAAIARMNSGVARIYSGDVRTGRRRLESAARTFREAGHADRARQAEENLAWSYLFDGQVATGLRRLETLASDDAEAGQTRREGLCRMDLAHGLLNLGDVESALRQARRAETCLTGVGADGEALEAALWAAAAEPEGGEALAALATRARAAARPDLALRAQAMVYDAELRAGVRPDLRAIRRHRAEAEALGQGHVCGLLDLVRGEALRHRGRLEDALVAFASKALRRPGLLWLRLAAETGRARIDAARGDIPAAQRRLARLVRELDGLRLRLPGAWLRTSFLLSRLDPVLTRIELFLKRGRPADRRKAEALLDTLALRSFAESWDRAPTGAEGVRLRGRLEAVYDELSGGGTGARGFTLPRRRLEAEARRLESALADLWRDDERAQRGGRVVHLSRPMQAQLDTNTCVLHLWTGGDRLWALARRGDRVSPSHDLGAVADIAALRAELEFHVRRARQMGSPRAHQAVTELLAHMARRILAPFTEIGGAGALLIVQGPDVPDLPLECLPCGGKPLAATCHFLRVPAAGLPRARGRKAVRPGTELFALAEEGLGGILREIEHLSGRARIRRGKHATRSALRDALTTCEVVHVAGHGLEGGEVPPLGGVRVADGWFTAADLPARVGAHLVVLAACQTHEGRGKARIAWGGLPRGLLRRGAGHVVWTAADVDDSATAAFMGEFHDQIAGLGVVGAFGQALAESAGRLPSLATVLQFRSSGRYR